MNEAAVGLAAGCVLQIAEATFAPREDALVESLHIEVIADPSCAYVDLSLPPGAVLGSHRARQRLGDGTGHRLGEERWELSPRDIRGGGSVRLHLPELVSGDRVLVDLQRVLPGGSIAWRPGPARFAAVEASGGAVLASAGPGGEGASIKAHRAWATDLGADWWARIEGGRAPEPLGERMAPGDVRIEERLTLSVPRGDPQLSLYPGGGSAVTIERFLAFPPSEYERAWPLPLPPDTEVSLLSEPIDAVLERDAGAVRVVVPPSEAPARVTVRWEQPDAPSYGERAPEVSELSVDAPGGEIRWEGDGWWLLGISGRLIMPDRSALVLALDRRFREAALPEPGAPMSLRGREPSWELAADLRPTLLERSAIGAWPADPLWPRKLVRARRSSALTPTEAALILWLYARQAQLDADWVLVRPAPEGPAHPTVPTGIGGALVRITLDGEQRWIDPSCGVCGPFELPPELEGAGAFGRGIDRTPEPTRGRHEVVVGPDTVTWRLEGPPALLLRRWLAQIPASQRTGALAHRIGGPGASLVEADGIERAGEPIVAVVTRAGEGFGTPLTTPPPDPSGTVWFDWIGERVVSWPDHDLPDAEVAGTVARWRRYRREGALIEELILDDRRVPADEVARIEAARAGRGPGESTQPGREAGFDISRPGSDLDPP